MSLLQHHSSKASILRCSAFFMVHLSHPYMITGKIIDLTRWTFVGKVMSLLFNMLSKFVIVFLPRSNRLLISWLQSPSTVILEPRRIVCHCFHRFPICLPWRDGTGCHDLRFLNAEVISSFLARLGLRSCAGISAVARSGGCSLAVVHGLLVLQSAGSRV